PMTSPGWRWGWRSRRTTSSERSSAPSAPATPDGAQALAPQIVHLGVVDGRQVAHDPRQEEIGEGGVAGQRRPVHVGGEDAPGHRALGTVSRVAGAGEDAAEGPYTGAEMGHGAVVLEPGQ